MPGPTSTAVGATLYEAMTGEPPFRGTAGSVLRQVIETDPRAPRRINSALPRDLETICLKAMARDPARRYPTARDLADDLGRFLRGETILARPAGILERTWRSLARRPLIAGLAASLAVVSLTGFAGVVWQWRRAEAQRAQAEHNFREARRLVDTFYTRIFTEGLFFRPGLESLRREMFRDLLGYYRDFLRQRRDDPTLQDDLAEACFRVGRLTTEEGDRADAIEVFRQADSLFQAMERRNPADRGAHEAGAMSGQHRADGGRAWPTWRRPCVATSKPANLFRKLVEEAPRIATPSATLPPRLGNVANLCSMLHDSAGARLAYREVLEVLEQLVAADPSVPRYRDDLALTYNNMAFRKRIPSSPPETCAKRSSFASSSWRWTPPTSTAAATWPVPVRTWASMSMLRGAIPRHSSCIERCCRLLEEVVQAEPTNTTYQCDLADGYLNLGDSLGRNGRLDESVRSGRRAREVFERLLATQPRLDPARNGLMGALSNISESLSQKGQFAEAVESIEKAVEIAGAHQRATRG